MKLLFVAEKYEPDIGGVAASATRISRSLARLGHEVHVFALSSQLPSAQASTDRGPDGEFVHRFGSSKNLDFTLQQSLNFIEWLHEQESLDAVWGHYAQTAGFLATWIGKWLDLPSILAVRGNDLDKQMWPPGDFGRLRWTLESAHTVVAVSRELTRKVETLVGRTAEVLPNAVDTSIFEPGEASAALREQYQIQSPQIVLAFSGELRTKKGLGFLIEAFRQTLANQPARLLIIGEVRRKDRGEYERWISGDTELARHIQITGHLSDPRAVAEHLRLADVFLLPSVWEGMPNSLLEAMAVGVPVVASTAGAISEVVRNGQTGLLVPKTHLHQLSRRIEDLLSMPADLRAKIIRAAREQMLADHSLQAEAERLSQLLESLPSKPS